jgi:diaminopimelate epimerase
MKFTKMHGLGNDYIYINCFTENILKRSLNLKLSPKVCLKSKLFKDNYLTDPAALAIKMSNRHFGVGGDGIVLIMPSENADAGMRMFNADGSEAEMCGNAIRCVGKYLYERRMVSKPEVRIETKAGIKQLELIINGSKVDLVRVDMGQPELQSDLIPVSGDTRRIINELLLVNDHEYRYTAVSMGNPHCVIFEAEIYDDMVLKDGPAIEAHPMFPQKINVEFCKVIDRNVIQMRVWERGSGETLACGTGSGAAVVAAVLNNLTDLNVTVKLRGGDLMIEWNQATNHVYLTGPAVEVFQGEYFGGR